MTTFRRLAVVTLWQLAMSMVFFAAIVLIGGCEPAGVRSLALAGAPCEQAGQPVLFRVEARP